MGDQFQWRLCYRASAHGWSAQNFHTNCDNKGPTVTLVKVGGNICGGYTDQNWAGKSYKMNYIDIYDKGLLSPFLKLIHYKGNLYYNIRSIIT